jgi:hypothetical protein
LGKGTTTADDPRDITVKGVKYPLGLGTHPTNASQVKFLLRGLKAKWFHSSIALDDSSARSESPLTFVVLGDGKALWTSKPAQLPKAAQECNVNVSGIDVLELRVDCPGSYGGAAAVWLDPYITTGLKKTELNDYLKKKPYPVDLRIVAVIDGSDEVRFTSTEAQWNHVSFGPPNGVKINGIAWNPHDTPVMKTMGVSQLLGKDVEDLSKVRMRKLFGRGRAELRAGKDSVTVVFDDPEPGAAPYEVVLTFEP